MLLWQPVVHHRQQWATGGDLWGIWRAAHYVAWGFVGGVYSPGTGVVSFPGMAIVLAPLTMVSSQLGLTESVNPVVLPHPTAALLLQPAEILLSSTAIFAANAVAAQLGADTRRRLAVCLVVGLLAWPVGVLWGHAEDTLAVAVAMYALLAADNRKWSRCGWLFSCAIVIQPLVALLLPVIIAVSPAGQRLRTLGRSAVLPIFLLGVAFAGNAAGTWKAVVTQPTPPIVNHATPWVALAPVVGSVKLGAHQLSTTIVSASGRFAFHAVHAEHVRGATGIEVSGGPGRFVYVAFALAAGLFVWRRPQPTVRLFWIAALVLGGRCLFEAVMTPYYLAPPLILAIVVASRSPGLRFWCASTVAFATSVFAYLSFSPWIWWPPVVAGSAVVLALAFPDSDGGGQPIGADILGAARREQSDEAGSSGDAVSTDPLPVA